MIILPLAIREIFSSWQMLSPPFLAMAPNYFCNESGHENFLNLQDWQDFANVIDKGKSLSEALLFAEYGEKMLFTKMVLNVRNNFCTQHVLLRFELGIFMY